MSIDTNNINKPTSQEPSVNDLTTMTEKTRLAIQQLQASAAAVARVRELAARHIRNVDRLRAIAVRDLSILQRAGTSPRLPRQGVAER